MNQKYILLFLNEHLVNTGPYGSENFRALLPQIGLNYTKLLLIRPSDIVRRNTNLSGVQTLE